MQKSKASSAQGEMGYHSMQPGSLQYSICAYLLTQRNCRGVWWSGRTTSRAAMAQEDPQGATNRYQIDTISIPSCVTRFQDEEKKKGK